MLNSIYHSWNPGGIGVFEFPKKEKSNFVSCCDAIEVYVKANYLIKKYSIYGLLHVSLENGKYARRTETGVFRSPQLNILLSAFIVLSISKKNARADGFEIRRQFKTIFLLKEWNNPVHLKRK